MLIIISPAKTLDTEKQSVTAKYSQPEFLDEAQSLIGELQNFSPDGLSKIMKISPKLADLNWTRFKEWILPFTLQNSKQALLCFKGDVYTGLEASTLQTDEIDFANNHLRILSGLYGILRPFDLMQAYRLEMGIPLKSGKRKNLYGFWGDKITNNLNKTIADGNIKHLINLASNEYYKAIDPKNVNAEIITPVFKEFRNGQYKFLSVFGKRARGLMARFIIQNKLTDPEQMKLFDMEGYYFNDKLSGETEWVFTRG
ncbi:MAG: peroxide stress protein YaaA [Bacteroidetes bacterium]|nr:MAG: peroxide stress protein YaaA [Bacteroidota bacterium]